ncbi:MAG TPA: hypothetical protein VF616_04270 [Duganella sp.]|uniref:hypothetical protein n=1 Tax=Duganella sp. TaxID=1904440 RepID=UPI002ED37777
MKVKVIKSQQEYDAAMARLSELMGVDLVSGSEEEAELELLALVIEDYERGIVLEK